MKSDQMPLNGLLCVLCAVLLSLASQTAAAGDLEKATQNPIASSLSLEIQNTTVFGLGPESNVGNLTMIQPVLPHPAGSHINIIHRPMLPLMYMPPVSANSGICPPAGCIPPGDVVGTDGTFGLGDMTYQLYVSPAAGMGGIIWGVGPAFRFPTATNNRLGTDKWSTGFNVVALAQPGDWTVGMLVMHLWSFAGNSAETDVSEMTLQPFINYSLGAGWALATSPVIIANWEATGGNQWTVPLGAGINKLFATWALPVVFKLRAHANVVKPEGGGAWDLQFAVQPIIPL